MKIKRQKEIALKVTEFLENGDWSSTKPKLKEIAKGIRISVKEMEDFALSKIGRNFAIIL